MLNLVAMDAEIEFVKSVLTNDLVAGGFPLLYKGNFDHDLTRLFTDSAEGKMIKQGVSTNVMRRAYHILVEALQNITRHSDNLDEESRGNGIILFSDDQDNYYIITGNKILNSKIDYLKNKIDSINATNKSDLREMRRAQMRDGEWSDKGGAGLGLIDMARKADGDILYYFEGIDGDYSFFVLKVTVNKTS